MVAATYLLVAAEFVAWVQVLIYVGAIVVLLLFSLMLTKAPIGRDALDNQQRGLAALVAGAADRSEEHTSELQSHSDLVCRLLLEKKKKQNKTSQSASGSSLH